MFDFSITISVVGSNKRGYVEIFHLLIYYRRTRTHQNWVKLDVRMLLQKFKLELCPTGLANPRRPLLREDVVSGDLAETPDHFHLRLGMVAQHLDVVLARVLELEGELPIFKTEDLPMLDGGRTFFVHSLLVFFLKADQALQDVALVFMGHLK